MRFSLIDASSIRSIEASRYTNSVTTFRGLNQNLAIGDGEWSDMKNMSDHLYPSIATRRPRGVSELTIASPKALMHKNGLFYIDGTKAYYKGTERFTVSDTDKLIVGMGAYIVVFPDGIMYNTFTNETEYMAASMNQSGTVTFAPLSKGSVYTKITATGIHNKFKKGDNVEISGCTNSSYNGTHIIIDAGTNFIVISGSLDTQFTQASGLKFERKIPSLDFVCERDNRLWGCSTENHEVYCCKVGDPKNWYSYETGADMAWAATVGSDGDFTACTKFSTYCLFFKENTVHILRGDKPSNFSLSEKALPGVRTGCSRSVLSINDTLYYVGRNGIYSFDGAIPQKISDNIKGDISDAVASQYESKYYLSCKLDGVQKLIVYDPKTHIFDIEDDTEFKFADYSDGMLWYIGRENSLAKIYGDKNEVIDWFLEADDLSVMSLDMKYVSKIKLNLWLKTNTEVNVSMKFDDDPMWYKKGYIRATKNKTYTIPVNPMRCTKYCIRIEGKGQAIIMGMSTQIEQGSELNGSLQHQYIR